MSTSAPSSLPVCYSSVNGLDGGIGKNSFLCDRLSEHQDSIKRKLAPPGDGSMWPMRRRVLGQQVSTRSGDQHSIASSEQGRDHAPFYTDEPFGHGEVGKNMQAVITEEQIRVHGSSSDPRVATEEPLWVEALRRDMQIIVRKELSEMLQVLTEMNQSERNKQMDMEKTQIEQVMHLVMQSRASENSETVAPELKSDISPEALNRPTHLSERSPATDDSEDLRTILMELRNLKLSIENSLTNVFASIGEFRLFFRGNSVDEEVLVSTEALGVETSFGAGVQDTVLQAVLGGDINKIRDLLGDGLDPNIKLENVTVKGTLYTHFNLVAAAVTASDTKMLELLVNARADPESKYGLRVGPSRMGWYGPAAFMAIAQGSIEMLQSLVSLRASLDAGANDNSNMVWHAAYYDKVAELQYVLDHGVSYDLRVAAHHKVGVTYTPLHIAIVRGSVRCVMPLLHAKASVKDKNEENSTPLSDAIECSHHRIITRLVSLGADLFGGDDLGEIRCSAAVCEEIADTMAVDPDRTAPIDKLIEKRNPVLLCAAAVGLQKQHAAAERLSLDMVCKILKTQGRVKTEILKAIFIRRRLRYRDSEGGSNYIKTAVFGIHHGFNSFRGHPIFPHVVPARHSSYDLEDVYLARKEPDTDMKRFINALAPQERKPPTRGAGHVPVTLFQCVVPGIHQDLRVLKILAGVSEDDDFWLETNAWAIFKVAWCRVLWMAKLDAACHILLLYVFCLISYFLMQRQHAEEFFGVNYPANVQLVAAFGFPFWSYELFSGLLQLVFAYVHDQHVESLIKFSNLIDACGLVAGGMLLGQFCMWDPKIDGYTFRALFGVWCFFQWVSVLWKLSPFRIFGFRLLPLLLAMRDIGPFVVTMMFYLFGLAHAFAAWDFLKERLSNTILASMFFGMLADTDRMEGLYNPNKESYEYLITSLLMFLLAFLVPVSLMNVFIARLGYSYQSAMDISENLYRSRVAQSVVSNYNMYYAVRKICCSNQAFSSNGAREYLWYCDDNSLKFNNFLNRRAAETPQRPS